MMTNSRKRAENRYGKKKLQLVFVVSKTRQVDSQLMGFLVEVAALEAEGFGGVGDV
jgi:hypothetical protein